MEPEIKSNFDDIKKQGERAKRRNRWSMLISMPVFLFGKFMAFVVRYPYLLLIAAIAVAVVFFANRFRSTSEVKIEHTGSIGRTVNHITQVKAIGQWEALHISCEEMVDTTEEHFFGDKNLIKIYRGTMIIGIDLADAAKDWFTARGDTALLRLPKVRLLNPRFIDEAGTRTFYEKGTWNERVNEVLYEKARKAMLRRNLTSIQINFATDNIHRQFESMFLSFGYKTIIFLPESREIKK